MTDRRVLVTGGAGFIGSALVHALNARGVSNILVVDRLGRSDKWMNLRALRFADYLEADDFMNRLQTRPGQFDDCGLALHLGACTSTTERDAGYLVRNNFQFTKMLADWALASDCRFVYASSAATYGGLENELSESLPLESLRPLNPYGYSKQLFDLYAQRRGYLDSAVGLKYFNVFGPNEYHKGDMRSIVIKAFEQATREGIVWLFKSHRDGIEHGKQQRDFVYIRDAVAMSLHLAFSPRAHGIFNVGSGRAATFLDAADAVFKALNKPARIEFIDMPDALRPTYQYMTQADLTRVRQAGYETPTTALGEAIREYVTTYLSAGRRLGDEPD